MSGGGGVRGEWRGWVLLPKARGKQDCDEVQVDRLPVSGTLGAPHCPLSLRTAALFTFSLLISRTAFFTHWCLTLFRRPF